MSCSGIDVYSSITHFCCREQGLTEVRKVEDVFEYTRMGLVVQMGAYDDVSNPMSLNGLVICYPDLLWRVEFPVCGEIGVIVAHVGRSSRVHNEVSCI